MNSAGHSISKLEYGFIRAKHKLYLSFCNNVLKTASVKTCWCQRIFTVLNTFVIFGIQKWWHFQISVAQIGRGITSILFLQ
jgi:hypothetical protein